MIIVKLQGGLGNQMFQYAAGRALALRHRTTLKLDLGFLLDRSPDAKHVFRNYDLDIFKMAPAFASQREVARFLERSRYSKEFMSRIRRRLFPVRHCIEAPYQCCGEVHDFPKNTYLEGYWQSPGNFKKYESAIREDFRFSEVICPQSADLVRRIGKEVSVCVNVRRTDFLTNTFHSVCDMAYFLPAMQIMRERYSRPHFFVFSDDPDWCVRNFDAADITVVGHEHKGTKFSNYLQLMASCRHFVIPNSTFAWWAVWFNQDGGKTVIAPKRWFADASLNTMHFIPETWIRLDN